MIRSAIDSGRPISIYRSVMPGSLLTRELLVTLARPRALLLKIAIPLLLTVPLVTGHAPTFWSGMLLTVLAAMTGAVGSAVSVARARESGLLARLAVTPRSPGLSMLSWVAGSTLVDATQLAPTLLAIFVLAPVTVTAALSLVVVGVAVLFMANVLGAVVSAAGGGTGEVLIDVAVLLAPLLFLGGLFTGVPRDGWRWVAAHIDPFSYLDSAFIRALGGVAAFDERSVVVASCITAVVAAVAIVALGRLVLRRR